MRRRRREMEEDEKERKRRLSQTRNLFFFGGPGVEEIKKTFFTEIDKLTIVYGCISDGGSGGRGG